MLRKALLATLLALPLLAAAAPPTEASVNTLLEATKAQTMLDQVYAGMEQLMRQNMNQAAAGRELSEEQKRTLDMAPARLAKVMRQELSWDKLRPIYVAIYRDSFDQAEIDGLIAFYQSPVGQTFVAKMPAVMQRSMAITQAQMVEVAPKLKAEMEQVLKDAKLPPKT